MTLYYCAFRATIKNDSSLKKENKNIVYFIGYLLFELWYTINDLIRHTYMDKYLDIIANLLSLNDEYEWLDFKENWFDKDAIGEYISAVANGACLCGKEYGYIL